MSEQPYEHWEKVFLADDDIAFELARFSEEGLDHQQIRHNGEAITVRDTALGEIEQVGPIAAFAATPSRIDRSAPALDDHGDDFSELPARSPSTAPAPAHALDGDHDRRARLLLRDAVRRHHGRRARRAGDQARRCGGRSHALRVRRARRRWREDDGGQGEPRRRSPERRRSQNRAGGRGACRHVRQRLPLRGRRTHGARLRDAVEAQPPPGVRARRGLRRRRSARPPPDLRPGRPGRRREHRPVRRPVAGPRASPRP